MAQIKSYLSSARAYGVSVVSVIFSIRPVLRGNTNISRDKRGWPCMVNGHSHLHPGTGRARVLCNLPPAHTQLHTALQCYYAMVIILFFNVGFSFLNFPADRSCSSAVLFSHSPSLRFQPNSNSFF